MPDKKEVKGFEDINISDSPLMKDLFIEEVPLIEKEQPDVKKEESSKKKEDETTVSDKSSEKKSDVDSLHEVEDTTIKKIKVGDKELAEDELLSAIEALENKKKWQEENTKKSQQIAEIKKQQDALYKIWEMLRSDGNTLRDVEDIIDLKGDEDLKKAFEFAKNYKIGDEIEDPLMKENENLTFENLKLQAKISITEEAKEFKSKYKLRQDVVDKVVEKAIELCDNEGKVFTLEETFKLNYFDKYYDKAQQKIKEDEDNKTKFPESDTIGPGVKEIKSQKGKPKDFAEIDWGGVSVVEK